MNFHRLHDFAAHEYVLPGDEQSSGFLLYAVEFDYFLARGEPVLYLLRIVELFE